MKLEWVLMATNKPHKGVKFVALYNDGSGGSLFCRLDNGDYTDDKLDYIGEEVFDDYLLWCEVPQDYLFFGEDR